MNEEIKKDYNFKENNDEIEDIYNKMNLISEKSEYKLKKDYQDFIKTRQIIIYIIFTGFLIFFILLLLNIFYLIILIELITTITYIIYGFYLELKLTKRKRKLYLFSINLESKIKGERGLKKYQILFYLLVIITSSSILIISLMGMNIMVSITLIIISWIYLKFSQENEP